MRVQMDSPRFVQDYGSFPMPRRPRSSVPRRANSIVRTTKNHRLSVSHLTSKRTEFSATHSCVPASPNGASHAALGLHAPPTEDRSGQTATAVCPPPSPLVVGATRRPHRAGWKTCGWLTPRHRQSSSSVTRCRFPGILRARAVTTPLQVGMTRFTSRKMRPSARTTRFLFTTSSPAP